MALCQLIPLEKTYEKLQQKTDELRQEISKQEFSPEQIQQIQRSYHMWRDKVKEISTQHEAILAQIDECVVSIDQKAILIDQMITTYHNLLLRLSLLPPTTQLANGVDYHITLEHVEDVNSVTTRNAQQYQRQILNNPVLAKLEGVLEEYQKSVSKAILSFREELVKYDVRLFSCHLID